MPGDDYRLKPTRIGYVFFAVASLFFAVISCWKIFEGDLFWLCRAGEEILTQHIVQRVDTWSSTAYGHEWNNFQWLSSVAFFLVSQLHSDYAYLPLMRSTLIFAIFFTLCLIIRKFSTQSETLAYGEALLLPCFYLVNFGRLQLRPDIFGILLFACGLLTFSVPQEKYTFPIQFLILLLWANFHGGTFPIGLSVFVLYWLNSPGAVIKIALGTLTWFCTPIHFHVLEAVKAITFDYDWTVIFNPDHLPLTAELLDPFKFGATYILWIITSGIALVVSFRLKNSKSWFVTLLVLDTLTLGRVRARPYSWLASLPMLVIFIEDLTKSRKGKIACTLAACTFWFVFLPLQMKGAPPLGLGVNSADFPVETARFLNLNHPVGKMINHYDFGGYLIDQARGYPVAQDGRETIFADFFKEKQMATENPESFSRFLQLNHFDIVLSEIPSSGNPEIWYPKKVWALVAKDQASTLYLRRTPENLKVIEAHEIVKND